MQKSETKAQKERESFLCHFVIFGEGRLDDDEEKQERRQGGEKLSVGGQGGQRGRRIVKEECHLNKEVASAPSSSQDGSFRRPKLPPTILRYREGKFREAITDNDHRSFS